MRVAGCVPAYNNESTIAAAIASLKAQTIPLDDIFIVDDGSTDSTAKVAIEAGARVISMGINQGRGAARARAIEETQADLLLSVDGTNVLTPDFLAKTFPWFEDSSVAAVYGRITQSSPRSSVDRWRGRHLYKEDEPQSYSVSQHLASGGFTQRTIHLMAAGNFDTSCRHSEDAELGKRLTSLGYKVIYEPQAVLTTLTSNTLMQVFERYWRWNQAADAKNSLRNFAKFWWYSLKVLALRDVKRGDLPSALYSAILPYYCAYRSSKDGLE